MRNSPRTLGQLVTATQTSTTKDLPLIPYLRDHAGMFSVIQGKLGTKAAREWLLGIALLELINQE